MKQGVETCHPVAIFERFDVLQEGGESSNDFASFKIGGVW